MQQYFFLFFALFIFSKLCFENKNYKILFNNLPIKNDKRQSKHNRIVNIRKTKEKCFNVNEYLLSAHRIQLRNRTQYGTTQ